MRLLIAPVLFCAAASPLAAQQWSVELQAGRIRSALDPANTAFESLAVGVRHDRMHSQLRLTAGIPTGSEQPVWGSVAAAHRFAVHKGVFVVGADLAGNVFLLHDRVPRTRQIDDVFRQPRVVPAPAFSGYAAAVQALPLLGVETAKLQLHVRGGVSHYESEFAEQQRSRRVTVADAMLTFLPVPSLVLVPAVRHFIADESGHTFAGVTAGIGRGPINFWGSTGHWLSLDEQELTWAAGVGVRVHDRLTLSAGGRRDVLDPLYGTPAQDSWNVGLSLKLGAVPPSRMPAPAVVNHGRATIQLPAALSAAAPRVAGDFTSWKPQAMQRSGNQWVYTVELEPGVYNYAFVGADGTWFVPEKHPGRKQDGMGGEVAVLVVR